MTLWTRYMKTKYRILISTSIINVNWISTASHLVTIVVRNKLHVRSLTSILGWKILVITVMIHQCIRPKLLVPVITIVSSSLSLLMVSWLSMMSFYPNCRKLNYLKSGLIQKSSGIRRNLCIKWNYKSIQNIKTWKSWEINSLIWSIILIP